MLNNLVVQEEDCLATVAISREKALNALSAELLRELKEVFEKLSRTESVRAVIVTGTGPKAFVAGADIAALRGIGPKEAADFANLGHSAMNAIDHCSKPVIAAVNGFCLGGGLELALACDFIYASESAKLGLPEVGLGLFPGWGGTQRLVRLIGKGRAKELILTGRILTAAEAERWGIVNRLCPAEQLITLAKETAREIAVKAPLAVMMANETMDGGMERTLAEGLKLEKETFSRCFETEDVKEGIAAFLEKRKPVFKGR